MNIVCYNNESDPRVLRKTLTEITSITAVPWGECSVINPVIRVRPFDYYADVNYIYIADYKRYYYVNDIIMQSGNILEFHCAVDVLQTYSKQILESTCICVANENTNTPYIRDESYPVSLKKTITTYVFTENAFNIDTATDSNYNYVLTVAGGEGV